MPTIKGSGNYSQISNYSRPLSKSIKLDLYISCSDESSLCSDESDSIVDKNVLSSKSDSNSSQSQQNNKDQ